VANPTLVDMLTQLLEDAQVWVPGASRAIVTQGAPAADCALLAVWAEKADGGPFGQAKAACQIQPRWWLHVTYWGCTPVMQNDGTAPPADVLTANALDFAAVGDAIWHGIIDQWHAGTLLDGYACGSIDLTQGMRTLPPQGGMAGWDATIIVTL
jgi:hypothetical protein